MSEANKMPTPEQQANFARDWCARRLETIEQHLQKEARRRGRQPRQKSGALRILAEELGVSKSYLHSLLTNPTGGSKPKVVTQLIQGPFHGKAGEYNRAVVAQIEQVERARVEGIPMTLKDIPGWFDAKLEAQKRAPWAGDDLWTRIGNWSVTDYPVPLDVTYVMTLLLAAQQSVRR